MASPAEEGIFTVDGKGSILFLNPQAEKIFGYGSKEVKGKPLSSMLSLPDNGTIESLLNDKISPAQGESPKIHSGMGQRKYGISFPVDISSIKPRENGDRQFKVRVGELSESQSTDMVLQSISRRRNIMAEMGIRVSKASTIREAAQSIVETAIQAADADVSRIFLKDDDGVYRLNAEAATESLPQIKSAGSYLEFRPGEGLPDWTAQKNSCVVVNDATQDPKWIPTQRANQWNLKSYAGIPIRRGLEVIGVFTVLRCGIRPF